MEKLCEDCRKAFSRVLGIAGCGGRATFDIDTQQICAYCRADCTPAEGRLTYMVPDGTLLRYEVASATGEDEDDEHAA